MKRVCPRPDCSLAGITHLSGPSESRIVRHGFSIRSSDSRRIPRFRCLNCKRTFSSATSSPALYQKKRRINEPLRRLLCSGVSQRRAARLLQVNPKTVARRLIFLAQMARLRNEAYLKESYSRSSLEAVQWDDLETSEHTKCKPLSVALAIDPVYRKILGFQVSQMPPKGPLVHVARKKSYPPRADQRANGWSKLMRELGPYVSDQATFLSDQNPHYPKVLKAHFPNAVHTYLKGRRGCIAGQGELKKIGFDPLFSLNHTCAMFRANLNRLFRRTWCTTKKRQGLINHLAIYVDYHNRTLTPPVQRPQGSGAVCS